MKTLKLISWNVNGIRACVRKGLKEYLNQENPDVFLAQETKAFASQCPEFYNEASGYIDYWHSAERAGYSGVGSFFKKKPQNVFYGLGDKEVDREGRVLVSDLGPLELINCYFPNGAANEDRHFFKMRFLERFFSWVNERAKKKPVIVAGDMNIAHQEIDIHDPVRLNGTSGFKPEERAWMDRLFDSRFVDAYRLLKPDKTDRYSWWSYRAGARQRNKGWRIDYFILSESLDRNLRSLKMKKDVLGSDHCPLVIELDFSTS